MKNRQTFPQIPLGELVNFVSGGTPSKQVPDYWGDHTPWVSAKDLKSFWIKSSLDMLSEKGRSHASIIPAGTVLILVRGMSLFKDVPLGISIVDLAINQDIKGLRPKDTVDAEFLAYALISRKSDLMEMVEAAGHGTGKLNTDGLKEFLIPCPPLGIQREVSSIIRTWSSTIEKMERLIKAKQECKRDFSYKLLFGKVRLNGKKANQRLITSRLSVPNDWHIVKIGSVSIEVIKKNIHGNDSPVLSCTKYQGLVDSLRYFNKQIFSKDTSNYKIVERGQFAYATNHIEEGSIGYQNLYPKGLVSPMYTVFKTDQKLVNDGYLYKLLKTETFRHVFQVNTSASVDRRGSLRWDEFSKLPIPLPSLDEQKEINELLETAQTEIDLLKRQVELLKKQKRALMQKLLTGEWRVKTVREVS